MKDMVPEIRQLDYKIPAFLGFDAMADDSVSLGYCSYGYNIACENGKLVRGYGVDAATFMDSAIALPRSIFGSMRKIFLLRRVNPSTLAREDALLGITDGRRPIYARIDSGVEYFPSSGITLQTEDVDAVNVKINGEDVLVLYVGTGGAYVYNSTTLVSHVNVPGFTTVCQHYGRIYGANKNGASRVTYSAQLEPLNFTPTLDGAGFVNLDDEGGAIQKLISFKDNLYIFRDYAIYRLTAFTSPSDSKLTKVVSGNRFINGNTAVVVGDRIIYLTDDGLMSFDGYNAQPCFRKINPWFENTRNASATFYDGKYFLAFKMINPDNVKIGDEAIPLMPVTNDSMLVIDTESSDVAIMRGTDIRQFLHIAVGLHKGLYCIFGNARGATFGKISRSGRLPNGAVLPKLWRTHATSLLQFDQMKTVKRAYVRSPHPIRVTVKADGKKRTHECGTGETQCLPYNLCGEKVALEIATEADELFVDGIKLDINVNRRLRL